MALCSKAEEAAARGKHTIDAYPNIIGYQKNELLSYLNGQNRLALVERKIKLNAIASEQAAIQYIDEIKQRFGECLNIGSELPARHAIITRTIDKADYRIDCLLIDSGGGYEITANFYYPSKRGEQLPAILLFCGHSQDGKAAGTYVSFCVEAVLNGFCVLVPDPIGQGERQLYASESEDSAMSPVEAHCFLDHKLSLTGNHLAQYMMRDNVKALDYLCSRSEVDTGRIAVTGNSGGGMSSAYMGAFDDRISVIMPSCYLTEMHAMISRIGAQDGEQCLPGFLQARLGLSDLVIAAAPKPYFVGSALFDFFPIDGTRDVLIDARKIYKLLGAEDKVEVYTAAKGHGFWFDIRMHALQFACRHMDVKFIADKGIDYESLPGNQELAVNTGVPQASGGVGAVFCDIVRARAGKACYPTMELGKFKHEVLEALCLDELQLKDAMASAVGNMRILSARELPVAREHEEAERRWSTKHLSFLSESGMMVYATLYEPKRFASECEEADSSNPLKESDIVVIHIGAFESVRDELYRRIHLGLSIMCVEPRGTGRAFVPKESYFGHFDPEEAYNYNARMLGKTIQGLRVLDVTAAVAILRSMGYTNNPIRLEGRSEHAITAIYAALINDIRNLQLTELLGSYHEIAAATHYKVSVSVFGGDFLNRFDMDDLMFHLLPGAIKIDGVINAIGHRYQPEEACSLFPKTLARAVEYGIGSYLEIC
jgi:hypothetical protein